jgi:hypothetical protein
MIEPILRLRPTGQAYAERHAVMAQIRRHIVPHRPGTPRVLPDCVWLAGVGLPVEDLRQIISPPEGLALVQREVDLEIGGVETGTHASARASNGAEDRAAYRMRTDRPRQWSPSASARDRLHGRARGGDPDIHAQAHPRASGFPQVKSEGVRAGRLWRVAPKPSADGLHARDQAHRSPLAGRSGHPSSPCW